MSDRDWKGVDLDGTLARFDGWNENIGPPIPKMVERVKGWLARGENVRILTARVSSVNANRGTQLAKINEWVYRHIGQDLVITSEKDNDMIELWDDRAITVEKNTGECMTVSKAWADIKERR